MTSTAREYLDLVSGIGVTSLGHAHPGLAAAIAEQASTLLHTSNLYFHPFQAEAAGRLSALSGLARTFFCNSGTEANEACLKFARRYWHTKGVAGRTGFVAIKGGFAGRTMGALSVTWDEHYRRPFMPLIEPVTFVDPAEPRPLPMRSTTPPPPSSQSRFAAKAAFIPYRPELAAAIREAVRTIGCAADSPTKCRAGWAVPATPSIPRRSAGSPISSPWGRHSAPACRSVRRSSPSASPRRSRPAITAATYGGNLLATRAAGLRPRTVDGQGPARARERPWARTSSGSCAPWRWPTR
jgi:hypothetical protein